MTIGGSLLSTLLAFAAMLLGLAIAVQVVQEMWKYVTSSRDKAYAAVLHDFLGPFHSRQLERPGVLRDLQVRGPFQFLWWRPSGKLLPMDADELVAALERTAGEWFQRSYSAIRLEVSLQRGTPAPASVSWQAFMRELEAAAQAGTNAHAADIRTFLNAWGTPGPLDAAGLLVAFHHQFLPQARKVGEHFDQLMRNYDFQYRRRNLRQTAVIAFLLGILFDLPAGKLYDRAGTMSSEDALELARTATRLHDELAGQSGETDGNTPQPAENRPTTSADSASANVADTADIVGGTGEKITDSTAEVRAASDTLAKLKKLASRALALAAGRDDPFGRMTWPPVVWETIRHREWADAWKYLFQCLLTSVLICFGAPLLNDLTKALLKAREGGIRGVTTGEFIERTTITAPSASPDRRP